MKMWKGLGATAAIVWTMGACFLLGRTAEHIEERKKQGAQVVLFDQQTQSKMICRFYGEEKWGPWELQKWQEWWRENREDEANDL